MYWPPAIGEVTVTSSVRGGEDPAFSGAEMDEAVTFHEEEIDEEMLMHARQGKRSK